MRPSPLSPSTEGRILATDSDLEKYCSLAVAAGATHAQQIHPSSVVTAPWVRLKCQFGCPGTARGIAARRILPLRTRREPFWIAIREQFCFTSKPRAWTEKKRSTRNTWIRWSNLKEICSRINIIGRFFFWQDLVGNARNAGLWRENLVLLRGKPDRPWKVAG